MQWASQARLAILRESAFWSCQITDMPMRGRKFPGEQVSSFQDMEMPTPVTPQALRFCDCKVDARGQSQPVPCTHSHCSLNLRISTVGDFLKTSRTSFERSTLDFAQGFKAQKEPDVTDIAMPMALREEQHIVTLLEDKVYISTCSCKG